MHQRSCALALAALIASSTLLLAGVLALALLLLLQMRVEVAHGGMSTRCVLGACVFLAPGLVAVSWTP